MCNNDTIYSIKLKIKVNKKIKEKYIHTRLLNQLLYSITQIQERSSNVYIIMLSCHLLRSSGIGGKCFMTGRETTLRMTVKSIHSGWKSFESIEGSALFEDLSMLSTYFIFLLCERLALWHLQLVLNGGGALFGALADKFTFTQPLPGSESCNLYLVTLPRSFAILEQQRNYFKQPTLFFHFENAALGDGCHFKGS